MSVIRLSKHDISLRDKDDNEKWTVNLGITNKPLMSAVSPQGGHIVFVERAYWVSEMSTDKLVVQYEDSVAVRASETGRLTCRLHNCHIVTAMEWQEEDGQEKLVVTHPEPIFDGTDATASNTYKLNKDGWLLSTDTWRGYLRRDLPRQNLEVFLPVDAQTSITNELHFWKYI